MKKLFTIYNYYGKNDGEDDSEESVYEDTPELRKSLVEDHFWDKEEVVDPIEDFVNGKIDSIYAHLTGGDWDEPTGRMIEVCSQEGRLERLKESYENSVNSVNKMFE